MLIRLVHLVFSLQFLFIQAFPEDVAPAQEPAQDQGQLARQVANVLEKFHYSRRSLDDALSKDIFKEIFKTLDPDKKFFLKSDYEYFKASEVSLDDAIAKGDVSFVNELRDTYARRVKERLDEVPEILKRPMDFTKDESFELDGDKKDFAKSEDEIRERWYQLLKYQVLTQKITKERANKQAKEKKTPEQVMAEIHERVLKSYERVERYALKTRASKMIYTFLDVVAEVFDPHTTHFSPPEQDNFNINLKLSFQGIGAALVSEDGYTKVVNILPGGPAERDGRLQPEDLIIEVAQGSDEAVNVVDTELDEVVQLIRGKKGTEVRLTVRPAGASDDSQCRIIALVRDEVKLEEESAKEAVYLFGEAERQKRFGYIKLPSFYRDFSAKEEDARSSATDVANLLTKLKGEKVDGLILDLRNNGGGSLPDAIQMAGLFIKKGPIVQVQNRKGSVSVEKDPDPEISYEGPLLVMVNQFSASASEIFAAAVQDYKRAVILGNKKTHGKGTVQTTVDLDRFRLADSGPRLGTLKITISKFYRISGASTQLRGVEPDIVVPGLYDDLKVGEAANDYSLPWDTIEQAKFEPFCDGFPCLEDLRKRSVERVGKSAYFRNVKAQNEIMVRNREETVVSLNEAETIRRSLESRPVAQEARKILRKWQLDNNLISKDQYDLWESRDVNEADIDPEAIEHEQIRFRDDLRKLPQEERDAWKRRAMRDQEVDEAIAIMADLVGLCKK
jgi:carboxyl-terminal processing protease